MKNNGEWTGLSLSDTQLEHFDCFANELIKWNKKINLTSIIRPEEIVVKHFVDSLIVALYVDVKGRILDIGSGGGFPTIPLKIALPGIEVVSVDSVEKKILFQRHIARLLEFDKFSALHCRVDSLAREYGGTFNFVISRAFADIPTFVKEALPFLVTGGTIIAMKGKCGRQEAAEAGDYLAGIGAIVSAVHEFELPILSDARSLVIIEKVSA